MVDIWKDIIAILVLIVINAFLSLSEASMLAVRKTRLQERVNEGDKHAGTALKLAGNPNRFLSTIQIGITVTDVLVGAISGAAIAELLAAAYSNVPLLEPFSDALGLGTVVLIVTYISIVFGELVPKRLAMHNADGVASAVAGVMYIVSRLFSPLVWLLSKSTDLVLRLFGVRHTTTIPVTEEEFLVQLDEGTQAGVFEATQQDMVEGVFSLSDQRVNALMTPRNEIVWLDVNDTAAEIRRKSNPGEHRPPVTIAVGGGKGGVGKTALTASLGLCLTALGQSVIAVDCDLGGANLGPALGLQDLVSPLHDGLPEDAGECLPAVRERVVDLLEAPDAFLLHGLEQV
mgnify:CR=1 FL=1